MAFARPACTEPLAEDEACRRDPGMEVREVSAWTREAGEERMPLAARRDRIADEDIVIRLEAVRASQLTSGVALIGGRWSGGFNVRVSVRREFVGCGWCVYSVPYDGARMDSALSR